MTTVYILRNGIHYGLKLDEDAARKWLVDPESEYGDDNGKAVWRVDLDNALPIDATDDERYQHADRMLCHYAAEVARLKPLQKPADERPLATPCDRPPVSPKTLTPAEWSALFDLRRQVESDLAVDRDDGPFQGTFARFQCDRGSLMSAIDKLRENAYANRSGR